MTANTGVLVHCEVDGDRLALIATELLGAGNRLAAELGQELSAVVIGNDVSGPAQEAVAYGAKKVFVIEDPALKNYETEPYLAAMEKIVKQVQPSIVLLGQTAAGRDLAPWLAFNLNTGATMDCSALEIDQSSQRLRMTRPVYGGNAQAVQVCKTDPQIVAVRNKTMSPAAKDDVRTGDIINVDPELNEASYKVNVVERKTDAVARVKLEDARVIIAGGRGMGSAEGFRQLEELAGILQGAVGSTRPPCDAGWISNGQQIGITGKIVSPDLYIAVGLSGASQHIAGFFGSKLIVAINKDPGANIFKVANLGIIADWKTVLPVLNEKLAEAVK